MKLWIGTVALVAALAHAETAVGNEMRERSLEERIAMADIIIVGTYECGSQDLEREGESDFVPIRVQKLVKGAAIEVVHLLVVDPIIEDQPDCCHPGLSYLMFLKRINEQMYASVNGRFGVYRLNAND